MRTLLLLLFPISMSAAEPPITAATFATKDSVLVASQAGVRELTLPGLTLKRSIPTKLTNAHDLAVAPTGDVLAIGGGAPGEDGVVELVAMKDGKTIRRLMGHLDIVSSLDWSRDGKRIVTGSADGTCRVFELSTGRSAAVFAGHAGAVNAVAFVGEGKLVLSGGADQSLRLWESETGKIVRLMENHVGAVNALAARPAQPGDEAPLFASASADRTVRLWQPRIGRMVRFKRLPSVPLSLSWTGDGRQLVAGCADGRIVVIDPDSLDVVRTEPVLKGWVHTLASKDRTILAAGEAGRMKIIELKETP